MSDATSAAGIMAAGNIGAGFLSSAGSVASGLFGASSAREQMRFEERMSSTAHQREVKDLIAAGLNPILSATGGRGAPMAGGAMATMDNPGAGIAEGLQQTARNLALDLPRLENETKMADANSAAKKAEAENINADTSLKLQNVGRGALTTEELRQRIESIAQGTRTSSAQEAESRERTGRIHQETEILRIIVPFVKQGGQAIQQLIDAARTGGPIGDAAANLVEGIQKELRMGDLKWEEFKGSLQQKAKAIIDFIQKHTPTLSGATGPSQEPWTGGTQAP